MNICVDKVEDRVVQERPRLTFSLLLLSFQVLHARTQFLCVNHKIYERDFACKHLLVTSPNYSAWFSMKRFEGPLFWRPV